jgi:hypothetical protein
MGEYEGVEIELNAFLTSAVGGGERPSSRPYRLIPGVKQLTPI